MKDKLKKNSKAVAVPAHAESATERTITFQIPDVGLGRMTNTTTRILMDLFLEETMLEKLQVLNSVIEHLGISPEDFNVLSRNYKRHGKLDYENDEPYSFQTK